MGWVEDSQVLKGDMIFFLLSIGFFTLLGLTVCFVYLWKDFRDWWSRYCSNCGGKLQKRSEQRKFNIGKDNQVLTFCSAACRVQFFRRIPCSTLTDAGCADKGVTDEELAAIIHL